MRNRNLISMIYANLEKTSAAAEKAAQTNARLVAPVGGCSRQRWGEPCAANHYQQDKDGPGSSVLSSELEVAP